MRRRARPRAARPRRTCPSSVTASGRRRGDHCGTGVADGLAELVHSGTGAPYGPSLHPRDAATARSWHGLTAVVAIGALVFQLALIIHGGRVLDETEPDPLVDRLWHFVSYFTVQSNALVAVGTVLLTRDPPATEPASGRSGWRGSSASP